MKRIQNPTQLIHNYWLAFWYDIFSIINVLIMYHYSLKTILYSYFFRYLLILPFSQDPSKDSTLYAGIHFVCFLLIVASSEIVFMTLTVLSVVLQVFHRLSVETESFSLFNWCYGAWEENHQDQSSFFSHIKGLNIQHNLILFVLT